MNKPDSCKVFGIGFHKTGTSSLAMALRLLGYSVTGPNGVNDPDIKSNVEQMAFDLVEKYDAFQDNPWPILFKTLDIKYPGSKFILTIRPTNDWITSVVKHFGKQSTPMREWIYGVGDPEGNEQIYINRYERHNNEVFDYFADKPGQFLTLPLGCTHEWSKLCNFLDKPIPGMDYPHLNKSTDRIHKI